MHMEYAINVYVCTQIAVNAFCKKFTRIPGRNHTIGARRLEAALRKTLPQKSAYGGRFV